MEKSMICAVSTLLEQLASDAAKESIALLVVLLLLCFKGLQNLISLGRGFAGQHRNIHLALIIG